jgi:hypothetical protein
MLGTAQPNTLCPILAGAAGIVGIIGIGINTQAAADLSKSLR